MDDAEITKIEQERKKEASLADNMGMDPSFGAFTGGKPPEEAPPGSELPPEAMPPQGAGTAAPTPEPRG